MNHQRIDIASIRKEQIVEAAVAVITEQGLHNLSLSEIETRADMKRGQLTYYFKHKEDILLAVFERLLRLVYERLGRAPHPCPSPQRGEGNPSVPSPQNGEGSPSLPSPQKGEGNPPLPSAHRGNGNSRFPSPSWKVGSEVRVKDQDFPKSGWELTTHLLDAVLTKPPLSPEFHCLQYTFLSQIGYREDFRVRLASLYDEWRTNMAQGLTDDLSNGNGNGNGNSNGRRKVEPRLMATLIQAILHGLTLQAAADPEAFDGEEMFKLCVDLLGSYLGMTKSQTSSPRKAEKVKPVS